jgi:hypothetical protein
MPLLEQGDLAGAIRWMSRAVLYETPWDEKNILENVRYLRGQQQKKAKE